VKPAGSPVCRPESLTSSLNPAVDFLFAVGANPNLPANSIRVVEVTIICPTNIRLVFRTHLFKYNPRSIYQKKKEKQNQVIYH
jgi:hypothetical protein